MKRVLVLGCTGSIGSSTLDVIRRKPDEFCVAGLSCGSNEKALDALCAEFGCRGTLFSRDGNKGLLDLIHSSGADMAVNGVAGSAGLTPSVMVLESGMDLALANKETVVMAWDLVKGIAARTGAHILPVDSEHSAVFCLEAMAGKQNVAEIVITASGGPFRTLPKEELSRVTPEQALRHPTWKMGPKITIDSASLANKGLEVIEACRLFGVEPDRVKVVVHPQSLVHSLVRTTDGMLYAQISEPDMRHPIQNALTWPLMSRPCLEPFLLAGHEMTFMEPRTDAFPMLPLAYKAAAGGAAHTIAYNAADEVAVKAFMEKRIRFMQIAAVTEEVLSAGWTAVPESVEHVIGIDREARMKAKEAVSRMEAAC